MKNFNRRFALKAMGAALLVPATKLATADSISGTAVVTDRTFRGWDDKHLVRVLRSNSVEFHRCRFLECGLLEFGGGRDLVLKDCQAEDTRITTDGARFTIDHCHFRVKRALGRGEYVLSFLNPPKDRMSCLISSSMHMSDERWS